MNLIDALPLVGAWITLGLGLVGLCFPAAVARQVGLGAKGSLALAEVRATYGGVFIGLGLGCLWWQEPMAYSVAALAWLMAAAARMASLLIERKLVWRNVAGLLVEFGIGTMLLLGLW